MAVLWSTLGGWSQLHPHPLGGSPSSKNPGPPKQTGSWSGQIEGAFTQGFGWATLEDFDERVFSFFHERNSPKWPNEPTTTRCFEIWVGQNKATSKLDTHWFHQLSILGGGFKYVFPTPVRWGLFDFTLSQRHVSTPKNQVIYHNNL